MTLIYEDGTKVIKKANSETLLAFIVNDRCLLIQDSLRVVYVNLDKRSHVSTTESGLSDTESMPCSNSHSANSG